MRIPFWFRAVVVSVFLLVPLTSVSQKPLVQWSDTHKVKQSGQATHGTVGSPIRTPIEELDHAITMKAIDRGIYGMCPKEGRPSKNCKQYRKDTRNADIRVMELCLRMKYSDNPTDAAYAREACATKPK